MKSTIVWALVAINALLLISFIARFGPANTALAQRQQAARPGDYVMIPGEVTGGTNGIIFIVDTTNNRLSAMVFNENTRRLENMPSIDLAPVFQQRVQPAPQPDRRGGGR